jgi:predicted acylesterase/phospholipase RssA
MTKRAICLGGGGPAAGLHIGVLEALVGAEVRKEEIKFGVWALSCIGAWVGIVYNQARKGREIDETKKFFESVFRDNKSYKSFPMNTIFAPDWSGNVEAIWDFLLEPRNYKNAFLPREIMKSWLHTMSAIRRSATRRRRYRIYNNRELEEFEEFQEFSEGDFNRWTLNHVLAVHPAVRFLTAMMYKSNINGLSRLYYPDSSFLKGIKFQELYDDEKPFIFHNAWNLSRQKLVLFANEEKKTKSDEVEGYRPINAASLCACSALPFIEQTVTIDGDIYCEGALVDTVNFKNLLEDNPDLEEIWISRIVDAKQIRPPRNLYDSQANLCELFAATVGEDDIKLFKHHFAKNKKWEKIKIIEIQVGNIGFEWSHANLERGIKNGEEAAREALKRYEKEFDPNKPHQIIAPSRKELKEKLQKEAEERARKRLTAAE